VLVAAVGKTNLARFSDICPALAVEPAQNSEEWALRVIWLQNGYQLVVPLAFLPYLVLLLKLIKGSLELNRGVKAYRGAEAVKQR
jgi:hypothetical protein